ncbi:MAG: murein peptide amidase [Conexibacter sp.]|nr:murein peptide amidase [Conexibacter sp.]
MDAMGDGETGRRALRPANQRWRASAALVLLGLVALATSGLDLDHDDRGQRAAATHPLPARAASAPARRLVVVGRSVLGRPIRATVVGDPAAPRRLLAVGCIHGDEPAGEAITRRLRSARPPRGVALWLVDAFNPDGCAAGTRQNAHGVDLNRNSPWRWRPIDPPGGTYYAGPRALSEPESRALVALVRRVRPTVTIWYHQHAGLVDDSGGDRVLERGYARLVGLPFRHYGDQPGSITGWQDATSRGTTAFVVELPAGALSARASARHAAAVLALARLGRPLALAPPPRGRLSAPATPAGASP